MKFFYYLLAIILMSACGNKKAEIVEEIKKVKNEWYEAEMNRGSYNSVANKLLIYNNSISNMKRNGNSEYMKAKVKIYKDSYEAAIQQLKINSPNVSTNILGDQKILDSIAFNFEMKANDLKHRIDSLELELKKY